MKITAKDIAALKQIREIASESSCSCNRGQGYGTGFQKHNRSCWVHLRRETYKRIDTLIAKAEGKDAAK